MFPGGRRGEKENALEKSQRDENSFHRKRSPSLKREADGDSFRSGSLKPKNARDVSGVF